MRLLPVSEERAVACHEPSRVDHAGAPRPRKGRSPPPPRDRVSARGARRGWAVARLFVLLRSLRGADDLSRVGWQGGQV